MVHYMQEDPTVQTDMVHHMQEDPADVVHFMQEDPNDVFHYMQEDPTFSEPVVQNNSYAFSSVHKLKKVIKYRFKRNNYY